MEFIFLNKSYNLSFIKSGISINNNQLLKRFDKNNNSIFDSEEITEFMNELLPYLDDNKIDNNEVISFLSKIKGITTVNAQKELENTENEVELAFETLIYEQAKKDAIEYNKSEIDEAMTMYETAMGGWISRGCNSIKEFFNTEYAGDKVYRQLVRNKVSSMMLEKSNEESLTVKEYIETKIDLLEALLGGEQLSQAEKNRIKNSIKQMNLEELDSLINNLANAEDSEYENIKKETLKELQKTAQNKNNKEIGFNSLNPHSIESLLKFHEEKIFNFDSVFELENGIAFDTEKVNAYNKRQKNFDMIARLNNRIAHQYNELNTAMEENNTEQLKEAIKSAMNNIFGNNKEAQAEFITRIGLNPLYNLSKEELIFVAKELQKELQNQLNRLLDGKSIDEHIQELGNYKDRAFGKKQNVELATKFAESQANGVAGVKMAVAGVGLIATLAGGPISLVGMAISVGGGAGVSFAEESSKPGEIPPDKQKEIMDELAISGALNLASLGSGAIASSIGKIVASKCPKLIACIAEYGSDAVMSLIADTAITGQVDFTGEGIAQLVNIATGIVMGRRINKNKSSISTSSRMEHNNPAKITTSGKTVDDVMPVVKNMCQKYNMNMDVIVNQYLKGLSADLVIFKNEETLKDYIDNVFRLTNKKNKDGNPIYTQKPFNSKTQQPDYVIDRDLVNNIALLKAVSPKHKEQLENLCNLVEDGLVSSNDLKKTLTYFKEGYISTSTINISISSNIGIKVTDLIDTVKPNKNLRKEREKICKTIEKIHPETKNIVKVVKKELGEEFYNIKWEKLCYKNLSNEDFLAFITDIKNIKYLKEIEIENHNFFIKINGYKKNQEWAQEMVQITENASHKIREGVSFDETMAYIASGTRELALKNSNEGVDSYGVIRGTKQGYAYDSNKSEKRAITPFDKEAEKYHSYESRFTARYSPNELHNPYAGRIELTRLVSDGEYPIEAGMYDPTNPLHGKKLKEDGSISYYIKRESMIHPAGKYGVEGLNIAEELHNNLMAKFQNKTITSKDLDEINETIAEIHWVIAHTMPWGRGSDAIANSYVKSVYQSLGIKTYPPKDNISFDLEAFCTELNDYKKNYKKLYEKEPEIVK